jgi:uncharacterized protein (DUF58 family)
MDRGSSSACSPPPAACGADVPPSLRARLLDPLALARYDRLGLGVGAGLGERPGNRRVPGHPQPSGIELEAHGAYAPGDDLRHLDWNVLGRLDALLVRRFTAEREVRVHLLVDASASMGVPARDDKLGVALELAMALAYIALVSSDAVRVALFRGGEPPRVSPVYRQRPSALRVGEFLAGAAPGGAVDLGTALEAYARRHPRPGAAVVVSDLMAEPAAVERGVAALRARRHHVVLLQVVGAREVRPERHFRHGVLRDVESRATHPVALTPAVLARYRALLGRHFETLGALAARLRATYARLVTGTDVHAFVTGDLARLGVTRLR